MKDYNEFKKAVTDGELSEELAAFIKSKSSCAIEEKPEAIAAFAKTHGYGITVEDICLEKAGSRELDESELENIAGGRPEFLYCFQDNEASEDLGTYDGKPIVGGCVRAHMTEPCSATVEYNSWCWSNDACILADVVYIPWKYYNAHKDD